MTPPRVLLVDDDRDHAAALATLARLRGWDVDTAHDVDTARRVLADRRPDALLGDITLDTALGGLDVATDARRLLGDTVFAIAYTGHASPAQHAAALAAGFDRVLVKPTPARELLDALADGMQQRGRIDPPSRHGD